MEDEMTKKEDLTIKFAQYNQPWTVPYAKGVTDASRADVPHILASHTVLHAAKSVGKLAAVFEAMDHPTPSNPGCVYGPSVPSDSGLQTIKDMSADLLTAALRLANLYEFDLSDELERRVQDKNKVSLR